MTAFDTYQRVAGQCSRSATEAYSTSFASAIRLLHQDLRAPIYAIYGLVRFADEIVDTFHNWDKAALLTRFREDTFNAIRQGLSLNPILHAFQQTVHRYHIDEALITAFFRSMETDLGKQTYHNKEELDEYIYGSAEVVGLMCLCVFCDGDRTLYERLTPAARALGAAFQKVNFLRDLGADHRELQRIYFPGLDIGRFDALIKAEIERDILTDFRKAYEGIPTLPVKARFGVYLAYRYYLSLFRKIRRLAPAQVAHRRIRIPNFMKLLILCRAGLTAQLNLIRAN